MIPRIRIFSEGSPPFPFPFLIFDDLDEGELEHLSGLGASRGDDGVRVLITAHALKALRASSLRASVDECIRRYHGPTPPLRLRRGEMDLSSPLTMGILNVTPDSFSDGGSFLDHEVALRQGTKLVDEGADILDIGGESTRPYSQPVDVEEELRRIIPVIEGLSKLGTPISVDTRKPKVAERALEAGATIINDISGLRDPEMIEVAASADAAVVIMHMLGTPETMQEAPVYQDVVSDIFHYLEGRCEAALEGGIDASRIVVDPGIGFGKSVEDNLTLMRGLREFRCLGHPVLVGASRKGFIGKILDTGIDQRLEGGLAVASVSVMNGADIVRTHDVKETARTLRMASALR